MSATVPQQAAPNAHMAHMMPEPMQMPRAQMQPQVGLGPVRGRVLWFLYCQS